MPHTHLSLESARAPTAASTATSARPAQRVRRKMATTTLPLPSALLLRRQRAASLLSPSTTATTSLTAVIGSTTSRCGWATRQVTAPSSLAPSCAAMRLTTRALRAPEELRQAIHVRRAELRTACCPCHLNNPRPRPLASVSLTATLLACSVPCPCPCAQISSPASPRLVRGVGSEGSTTSLCGNRVRSQAGRASPRIMERALWRLRRSTHTGCPLRRPPHLPTHHQGLRLGLNRMISLRSSKPSSACRTPPSFWSTSRSPYFLSYHHSLGKNLT